MAAGRARAPTTTSRVADVIGRSGLTGITFKQLASSTRLPAGEVTRQLADLAAAHAITRHGRGLWALSEYAGGRSPGPGFRGPDWYDLEFAREFGVSPVGAPREIQFGPNDRRPVHRWWPYVQGFSAEFVEETCRQYGVGRGSTVLDPFCGSGTVPTTARLLGARGIGADLMPIAALVARAKGEWDVTPAAFRAATRRVLRSTGRLRLSPPFLRETSRQFAAPVVRSLLRLKQGVRAEPEGPVQRLLELAFAGILIDSSHLKRAPCLGYTTKPNLTADTPFQLFEARAAIIEADLLLLGKHRASWGPPVEIHGESSATLPLRARSVDLAVTSPPYVNGMDYVMNYKIDLAWLDLVRSYADLARLRGAMVACDNIPRGLAEGHRPGPEVAGDPWVTWVAASIERNVHAKGTYRRADMARVVTKYFDDLLPVIRNVHRALRPGARFVVVNGDSLIAGTYVPGDLIFARLGVQTGFEVERFEIARHRRSGQHRGFQLRESVLTLRKPTGRPRPR